MKFCFTILTCCLVYAVSMTATAGAQSGLTEKVQELADKLTSTIAGKIIDVDGGIVYINLGEKDSIHVGARFEVVQLGDVLMLNNKPYYKEKPIGMIEVTRVRKDLSLARVLSSTEPITKNDKVYQINSITPGKQPPSTQVVEPQEKIIIVSGLDLNAVFRRLESAGFSPGPYTENDLTALSGAIKRFQKMAHLEESGRLDADTWAKMKKLYDPGPGQVSEGDLLKPGSESGVTDGESKTSDTTVAETVQTAGNELTSGMTAAGEQESRTIALMEFNYGNERNSLTENIYESLSVCLIQKGFQVVERTKLNQILKEQKLSTSGLIDISTAQKLGKLMGSDIALVGSLSDMGDAIAIRARMVDVEKGIALTAAEVLLDKTPDILALLQKNVNQAGTGNYNVIGNPSPPHQNIAQAGEFVDDFSRGPHPDWQKVSGDWTMANGKLTVATIRERQDYAVYLKDRNWRNLKLAVKVMVGKDSHRSHSAYICPRAAGTRDRVCFVLSGTNDKDGGFTKAGWREMHKGQWKDVVGEVDYVIPANKIIELTIEGKDKVYQAFLNGNPVSEYYSDHLDNGSISLGMYYDRVYEREFAPVAFDDVKVTPLK